MCIKLKARVRWQSKVGLDPDHLEGALMEILLVTLAGIAGGAWLVFVGHRFGQAHVRLGTLRNQRRRDGRWRR
jgi:hypothetical protein